jgi:DNA polymerase
MGVDHTTGPMDIDEARSAIDWWATAGVDTLIEEAPRDWLAPPRSATTVEPALPAPVAAAALPADLSRSATTTKRSPTCPSPVPARRASCRRGTRRPG